MFIIKMTEKDKAHLRRLRQERYNQLTYELKINVSMIAYRFCISDSEFPSARRHLSRAIEILIEKIEKEHC